MHFFYGGGDRNVITPILILITIMAETFRFPNGYDVRVLRKKDVLDSIDDNIIDKDIALEIVKCCEIDATNFLKEGRWAGIPFVGNIRIPKHVQTLISDETKALFADAKENLDEDKYLLFRHAYAKEVKKHESVERYYKYSVSKFVGKNTKFFRLKSKCANDAYARFLCFTLRTLDIISDE